MDKKLNFPGIDPDLREDQLAVTSDSNRLGLFAIMAHLAVGGNPNFIVSGCNVTIGGSVPSNTWSLSAGYIYLNGELLQVDAQSGSFNSSTQFLALSKVVNYNPKGDKIYQDGTPRQTWQENRGIVTVKSSVLTTELDAINGDRILQKLRVYIGDSTETNLGLTEKATTSEVLNATANKNITADNLRQLTATSTRIGLVNKADDSDILNATANKVIDSEQFNEYKFVKRELINVSQSGGNYSVSDSYDIYQFTSATPPSVTMPNPTLHKHRVIVIEHTNTTKANIVINNTASGGSQVDQFHIGGPIYPGSSGGANGSHMTFISTGLKWLCISHRVELVACPYIYINGEFIDEILKNQIGVENYREEIIEVTLNEGKNTIRLSEEKREITFIDYLILSVDGIDIVLFDERKVLKLGDYHEFLVDVPKHENATLRAKGYYIRD